MTQRANGTFEVSLTPRELDGQAYSAGANQLSLFKTFYGDLEGSSVGEMIGVRTAVEGSAGYVAMEFVTATLDGKSGGFVLQHSSMMDRGTPNQSIVVVPDSGTGELAGITGALEIKIVDGQHHYDFEYALEGSSEPEGGDDEE